jgi:hypothetical protein
MVVTRPPSSGDQAHGPIRAPARTCRGYRGQLTGGVCGRKVLEHQTLSVGRLIGDEKLGALDVQAFRQRHRAAEGHRAFDSCDWALWSRAEVFGKFGRPRDDPILRDELVDGPMGESLRGRKRLPLKNGNQRTVGADQAGQSLSATTARVDSEEHFRVADEEVAVRHDAQITGPGEFRAETERRTIERSNEDDAASIHPQQRRVPPIELDCSLQRRPGYHRIQDACSVRNFGRVYDGRGAALADRRSCGTALL